MTSSCDRSEKKLFCSIDNMMPTLTNGQKLADNQKITNFFLNESEKGSPLNRRIKHVNQNALNGVEEEEQALDNVKLTIKDFFQKDRIDEAISLSNSMEDGCDKEEIRKLIVKELCKKGEFNLAINNVNLMDPNWFKDQSIKYIVKELCKEAKEYYTIDNFDKENELFNQAMIITTSMDKGIEKDNIYEVLIKTLCECRKFSEAFNFAGKADGWNKTTLLTFVYAESQSFLKIKTP